MSADTLNPTKYNNVAGNTVNNAVLDAAAILAWRQDVKAVVDQHATEIDGKLSTSGGSMSGKLNVNSGVGFQNGDFAAGSISTDTNWGGYFRGRAGTIADVALVDSSGNVVLTIKGAVLTIHNQLYRGIGSPEGVLSAPVGALYQRTDGGASTTLYVKQSGTGNTGWVAK